MSVAFLLFVFNFETPEKEFYEAPKIETTETREIILAFVGDVMLDRAVEQKILSKGGGDFKFPFLLIAKDLERYDFLFGNLEGPISDEGVNVGSKYSFRMDPKAVYGLKFAGFDALSVANNHSADFGKRAFDETLELLTSVDIIPVGDVSDPKFLNVKGLKIAIVAFSDFPGFGLRAEDEIIKDNISLARKSADIVVASFHFGEEYQKLPSSRQRKIVELAVDYGADLIVGHHPHVPQPLEKYKDAYIAYSLGNFIFDQHFSEETMGGTLLEIRLRDNMIVGAQIRTIRLNSDYQAYFLDSF